MSKRSQIHTRNDHDGRGEVPFQIAWRLDKACRDKLIGLLENEVGPRLTLQKTGYARGRRSTWLGYQPNFMGPPGAIPCPHGRVWDELQRLVPGFETAECWINGARANSSPGIVPHRDASYAAHQAWIVNLGSTTFRIWIDKRIAVADDLVLIKRHKKFNEYSVGLVGDEIIAFDCKNLHGSINAADSRWGIGLWKFKPQWARSAGIRC